MRQFLVLVLLLGVAGSAFAANLSTRPEAKPAFGIYQGGGRVGGDTFGSAVVITPASLPYTDGGNTCGFTNDYDAVCPYSGSTAPDVVYSFTPTADAALNVDLCASMYDTKTYIVQDGTTVIACNDDAGCGYSGWQSQIIGASCPAGHVYYIVVDGYGSACGDYTLTVSAAVPCVVECPADGQHEGEPPCQDNYYDAYNGGCNSTGWTWFWNTPGTNCGTVCGKSCTYLYNGSSYRDTDWYTTAAIGGLVTVTSQAEFPQMLALMYVPNCNNLQYVYVLGNLCTATALSYSFPANAELWVFVAPSVYSGIPESNYVYDVCGIMGPTPTQETTWGQIKNAYK